MDSGPGSQADSEAFTCAICTHIYAAPSSLRCDHVFCAECITKHLALRHNCPLCKAVVQKRDEPTYLRVVDELIEARMGASLDSEDTLRRQAASAAANAKAVRAAAAVERERKRRRVFTRQTPAGLFWADAPAVAAATAETGLGGGDDHHHLTTVVSSARQDTPPTPSRGECVNLAVVWGERWIELSDKLKRELAGTPPPSPAWWTRERLAANFIASISSQVR